MKSCCAAPWMDSRRNMCSQLRCSISSHVTNATKQIGNQFGDLFFIRLLLGASMLDWKVLGVAGLIIDGWILEAYSHSRILGLDRGHVLREINDNGLVLEFLSQKRSCMAAYRCGNIVRYGHALILQYF